jgi:queuine tRNA-ribosyltransferase
LRLRNAIFRDDGGVIEQDCDCLACSGGFSRGYLRHLFMSDEMLGPILASIHNIRHFQRLVLDIRAAIRENAWSSFHQSWPVASLGGLNEAGAGGWIDSHPADEPGEQDGGK